MDEANIAKLKLLAKGRIEYFASDLLYDELKHLQECGDIETLDEHGLLYDILWDALKAGWDNIDTLDEEEVLVQHMQLKLGV